MMLPGNDLYSEEEYAYQAPEPVSGENLGEDAPHFYFLSIVPSSATYYIREGEAYRPIQAAFDTFGFEHSISRRSSLVLYQKHIRQVEGLEQEVYLPVFDLPLANLDRRFAVILPPVAPDPEKVQRLYALNFDSDHFPYGKVTFYNFLDRPLLVVLGEEPRLLAPGDRLQSDFSTNRRGAGYFRVGVAIRESDGKGRKLHDSRIVVYEGGRVIILPIANLQNKESIHLLVHREIRP